MYKLIFLLSVCLVGCNINLAPLAKVSTGFDPYKNDSIRTFECSMNSKEVRSPINNARMVFNKKNHENILYLTLYKNATAFYPEKTVYLNIDGNIIKLPFLNTENHKFKTASVDASPLIDSLHLNTTQSISYTENYIINTRLMLQEDVLNKLASAKAFSFRVYSGGQTNTFEVTDLKMLQQILKKIRA